MTKVERILAAIRGELIDKTPKGEFYLEEGFIAKLLQFIRPESSVEIDFKAKVEACEVLGLDALVFAPGKDQGREAWEDLRRWREQTDFFTFAILDGPFQGVCHQYSDFTTFLMDTVSDREKLASQAKDIITSSAKLGYEALEAGAHGIIIADDIAYQQGLYVSPQVMRELFFPYLNELVHSFSSQTTLQKVPVFFHSDGNLLQILGDIKNLGFDGIHSLEPVMEIGKVREITGDDFCLMGGFDLGWFNSSGTDHAKELLMKVSTNSRYIFGSSAGILDDHLSASDVLQVYRYVDQYDRPITSGVNLFQKRAE